MLRRNIFFMLLVVILIIGALFTGCSKSTTTSSTTAPVTTTTSQTSTMTSTGPTSTSTAPPSSSTTTSGGVRTGGILTIISPQTPSSFGYPVETSGNAPGFVNVPWIESFISSDTKGNLIPMLATSWETATDHSSITWHLRQGVKFHDGTDFDADAAKWNLDVYLQNGTGAAAHWSSVDVLDKYTVRVNI
jgi:peptide/nickel transport system substrate-binding protein